MCNKVFEFESLVTWTQCIFQGIVNKWCARMWLDRPSRCPMRLKKLHIAPRVKARFKKKDISLTWHSLISLFWYNPPWKKIRHFILTYMSHLYTRILWNHLNSWGPIFVVCQFVTCSWGRNFVDIWLGGEVDRKDNSGKVYFIWNELSFFTTVIAKGLLHNFYYKATSC